MPASLIAVSWWEITGWIGLLNLLVAGLTLAWVLSIKKESMSAVAWSLTIVLLPFLGHCCFLFSATRVSIVL